MGGMKDHYLGDRPYTMAAKRKSPTRRSSGTTPRRRATRKAARVAIEAAAPTIKEKIYAALLEHGPMTSDEVADKIGIDRLAVRPRITEMLKPEDGRLAETDEVRPNKSGKGAVVVRAVRK